MNIFKIRNKETGKFISLNKKIWMKKHHVKLALICQNMHNDDNFEIVEFELVEKAVFSYIDEREVQYLKGNKNESDLY